MKNVEELTNEEKQERLDFELRNNARIGDLEKVKELIAQGASANKIRTLLATVYSGHLEVIKYLAENGADIHYNNEYLLSLSVEHNHLHIVKYLISKGANMNTEHGNVAMVLSIAFHHFDIARYFIDEVKYDIEKLNPSDKEEYKWCKKYIDLKQMNDKLTNELEDTNRTNIKKIKL